MQTLVCVKCGTRYTTEREKQWGRTQGSEGYGPRPACTAMVPAPYAPKARRTGEAAVQVCGGSLGAEQMTDAAFTAARGKGEIVEEQPIVARGRRR